MSRAARLCRSGSWTCELRALSAVNAAGATRKHLTPQMYDVMHITQAHLCRIFPTVKFFLSKKKKKLRFSNFQPHPIRSDLRTCFISWSWCGKYEKRVVNCKEIGGQDAPSILFVCTWLARRKDEETVLHFEVCVREREKEVENCRYEVCERKDEEKMRDEV
jgi:hypothetical protein